MGYIFDLPVEFLLPGKKNALIEYLKSLPIQEMKKKQILIEYGDLHGFKMEEADIKEVYPND